MWMVYIVNKLTIKNRMTSSSIFRKLQYFTPNWRVFFLSSTSAAITAVTITGFTGIAAVATPTTLSADIRNLNK